jgi:hypothetical protein
MGDPHPQAAQEREEPMSLTLDLVLHDDGAFAFRARCPRCSFVSRSFDDEEPAALALYAHRCR